MQSPEVEFLRHSSARPMSRRHSKAAGLVMWARGSFDVPGALAMRIPFRPCWARKQARLAPAGPAPAIRKGVSIVVLSSDEASPLGSGAPCDMLLVYQKETL